MRHVTQHPDADRRQDLAECGALKGLMWKVRRKHVFRSYFGIFAVVDYASSTLTPLGPAYFSPKDQAIFFLSFHHQIKQPYFLNVSIDAAA